MQNVTIVVLPHGWVLIGELKDNLLYNAHVVRRWGTNSGLGELRQGPRPNTAVDKLGDIVIGAALFTLACEVKGWAKALA